MYRQIFNILDLACQQNVPNLDGGEGCSEYIIHGTNVDLSASCDGDTAAKQPGGTDVSQPSDPAPGSAESSLIERMNTTDDKLNSGIVHC